MQSEVTNLNDLLARTFPGLEAERNKSGAFIIRGVAQVGELYNIKLFLPHYPELRDLQLYVLQNFEYQSYHSGNLKLESEWGLEELLSRLPQLVSVSSTMSNKSNPDHHHPKISDIYFEIVALQDSQEYHMQMNVQRTRVRFSRFVDYDQHYLELELPTLSLLEHSLPECVNWNELFKQQARTLSEPLALYLKFLEELSPFYESFVDIDELCQVLQPYPITTKDSIRVFPLKDRVYIKLSIADPFAIHSSMELQIIGPTEEVSHLRHVLSDGLSSWDIELSIHNNLLRIFDLCYFPMPLSDLSTSKAEEEQQHCNICYVYRLDGGEVPLVSCDNTRCVLKCHAACLKKWFNSLSGGKTFLEVSFGLCPFCKAKLSTSFVALLNE
ncbi:E3 ubiquitin-protein ligase FANCL [Scaptodrosophila lebanonensis]|uniref:E3 ubiquitin-protein ligase FANCL n=1 Tax=Drosophila lebanonensis TaxID=7225 RepID=A0A6J2TJS0_DROLE|nr:E3 ubiquitin-protein ligase FANCL [Scaptodrosophila lebanonensis]